MAEIIDRGDGIHMFDNSAIQAHIDKALSAVPKDKKGAVVAFIDEKGNSRLSVAGKLGNDWTIVAEAKKDYHKPIEANAEVVFTWK